MHAHAEGGGFGEQDARELERLFLGAKHRETQSRPVLLHLGWGEEHIERSGGEEALHGGSCQFRAQVVEIRFNLDNLIDLSVRGVLALAEERAEDVRARPVVARPESIADLFDLHLRKRAERGRKLGEQRGAGRRDKFVRVLDLPDRYAGENLERCRRRHREAAVGAIRPTGAINERRGEHTLNIKSFNSGASCDDVSNGIVGADFMKRDVFCRNAVNLSFCHRDALKYGDASDLDEIAEPAFFDQSADLSKASPVIVVNMLGLAMGLELPADDPLADTALKIGVNLFANAKRANGRMKDALLDAEVPEGSDRHVTADA